MEIKKYQKSKDNTYILTIDNETISLYDDIIIKYELLLKKHITKEELVKIEKDNNFYTCYYKAIKLLGRKMVCSKEMFNYLKKNNYDEKAIDETIVKLQKEGYLDEEKYIEAYLHDIIAFRMDGPLKITQNLLSLNLSPNLVKEKILDVDPAIWDDKIKKIIKKKKSINHQDSVTMLKKRIYQYLLTTGYSKEQIMLQLDKENWLDDSNILQKEALKLTKKLSRKYTGRNLNYQLKQKLYAKGFKEEDIEKVLAEF